MLEASQHSASSFVTLTYSDENLPLLSSGASTLNPLDLTNWLKRFRKKIEPHRVRYYAVGEYGDTSERPHYHVALFGSGPCERSRTRQDYLGEGRSCCVRCDTVHSTWGFGRVDVARLENSSARYIAGYIEKKLTRFDDPRLNGRHPEFNRMSRHNGGLGSGAMHDVASTFLTFNLEKREADVPSALRLGKSRYMPLGKYLKKKLWALTGYDEKTISEKGLEFAAEVQAVYDHFFNLSKEARGHKTVTQAVKEHLISIGAADAASLVSRSQIFKSRKHL